MKAALLWFGRISLVAGILLVTANVALHFMGLGASYNLGDPSKFQFILISFWQIGVGLVSIGVLSMLAGRRL
ncbi:MAG: hypothetical protein K8F92_01560 [Hyphomicrobium sp.]|uniref:hypothetical protein n=1 Tax=Hyphomicrobium sp. TaxID=82 RepID=UPI001323DBC2|nr:hypothetical protein [Hyphomicrobium sp.]KAB2939583.1 MAG: hypothetical protein F9K20_16320 [Hyphomicrobium sp.]MBZ0208328.1 hypothetical protein [Hyphomicrobium sp.]